MPTTPAENIEDTTRAARFVAAFAAGDHDGYIAVINDVQKGGKSRLVGFATALGVRCAQLARELYGDTVQVELDGFALDASWLEEQEAIKREVQGDDNIA
jgi:hypothetical protein